ncbi:12345_t:CDS:2 [Ambispora leptoticha]|uniref:12345_t:CDS:1 n=1 Tax=Ambispora leptoticha TaxID=144679 RepID=A0A9N9FAI6_9GLOM|nr:12345_t:CDS:2 [Ambispora leptoticha]
MPRAEWNGEVIAESDVYETFPPESIKREYFVESPHTTTCSWKGQASYYTLSVNGKTNTNAAWYYPNPKPAAQNIAGYIAFWRGVKVTN